MSTGAARKKPPFWRWYPGWLHRLTCTHCRGVSADDRKDFQRTRQKMGNRP